MVIGNVKNASTGLTNVLIKPSKIATINAERISLTDTPERSHAEIKTANA